MANFRNYNKRFLKVDADLIKILNFAADYMVSIPKYQLRRVLLWHESR